ncbi:hypothetical protein GBAR_LOCUS6078 [Geodia barretti]|uniref:Uncharacterized protein n=1 Tax=Geodia barretti TaxID=519541 RepID=A0AA35REM5_GEOBA|nr:hypothetical protein GBAR_LOCUS6078 [Geodia barretti]
MHLVYLSHNYIHSTTGRKSRLPSHYDTNCTISNCSVGIDIFIYHL